MSHDDDSDATRIFNLQTSKEFSKAFMGRSLPLNEKNTTNDQSKKIRELTLLLAEAEASVIDKQKLLDLAQLEVKELRGREKNVFEKFEKAVKEVETLKAEINRLRTIERDYNDRKVSEEFLLQNYRSALSKYKSWFEYSTMQLEAMKTILEESGKWNRENRYKIFFSYKSLPPTFVSDDQVDELAKGSVVNYTGIDNIENINQDNEVSRFLNNSTQTEENSSSGIEGSFYSFNSTQNLSRQSNNDAARMSDAELQFLDLRERLRKVELENNDLKGQLYLARDAAKKATMLEEQNRDYQSEITYLKKTIETIFDEKERLAEDIQNNVFTDLAGPSQRATSREIIEKITLEKERNDTLLRKTAELEEEIRRLKTEAANAGHGASQSGSQSMMVEESTVYQHMVNNPFQQAVKEYEERESVKRRRLEDGISGDAEKVIEQEEQIAKLKSEIEKLNTQQARLKAFQTEQTRKYRESVRFITGYDIKMRNEECIEAASVFDLSNHFSFQREGKEMNLIDNDYANAWPQLMHKYLGEYDSLPCFTAAVTIDLRVRQLRSSATYDSQLG